MVSSHKFNEAAGLAGLLNTLAEGKTIALVTDGGTPAISDPGHRLVAAAHAAGHAVVAIAGPSAVAAALSVAGFPADHFRFAGFLPAAAAARRRALAALATEPETLVFYEAPHRALKSLDAMIEALGDREAALCRELTKLHEEVLRAPLSAIRASLAARDAIRGEIVLVVAGWGGEGGPAGGARATAERSGTEAGPYRALFAMACALEGGDPRRALRRLARELGLARAEVKARLLEAGVDPGAMETA
jgi:16S rRNA (cytidine1402-2'-O)-methyltransferase